MPNVIDLSFQEIATLGVIPQRAAVLRPKGKAKLTSIKLSSNKLIEIDSSAEGTTLSQTLSQVLETTELRWLDLSYNQIHEIATGLAGLDLSILYLHANQISTLKQLEPLRQFKHLKNLTLHGNPIADHKHYRMILLYMLPSLLQLDFTLISKRDREDVEAWARTYARKFRLGPRHHNTTPEEEDFKK